MKDVKQDLGSEGKTVNRTGRASRDSEPYGIVQPSRDNAESVLSVEGPFAGGRRENIREGRRGQGVGTPEKAEPAIERDDRRTYDGTEKKRLVKRRRSISSFNKELLSHIEKLKGEHPAWGYRRIWSYLKFHDKMSVNQKRIWRLMSENNLLVQKHSELKAIRKNTTHKMRSVEPNSLWGTDMTKIMTDEGWAYLHVVLDWASKKLLGCHLSHNSKTKDWLDALSDAVNLQFPDGIKEGAPCGIYLVSDHGSQPTSKAYIKEVKALGFQQVFCSYCNPKGNADTERVIRTIKEDLIWPREWNSFYELSDALKHWQKSYNEDFPHSALGYDTPCQYEKWFFASAS